MKKSILILFLIISCQQTEDITQYECYYSGIQKETLDLINSHRNIDLICDVDATMLAVQRALEITIDMSHNGYREVNGQWPGEILAYGFKDVESTVKGFLNSENHCKLLLDDKYHRIGIGVFDNYYCIILIK